VPVAGAFNDRIAEYPDRFAGFAVLATSDPTAASDELSRGMQERGFKAPWSTSAPSCGSATTTSSGRCRERRGAGRADLRPSDATGQGGLRRLVFRASATLSGSCSRRWHGETGLHALRLILVGVLNRFPNLQIGHIGAVIPFMLARIGETIGGGLALGPSQDED
jgi:hypothetical protein